LGIAPFKDFKGHDLLDVIEERNGRGSLIIASQLPLENCRASRNRWPKTE
jgi:hypothetical protein